MYHDRQQIMRYIVKKTQIIICYNFGIQICYLYACIILIVICYASLSDRWLLTKRYVEKIM